MVKIKFGHVMDAIMDLIANLYFINKNYSELYNTSFILNFLSLFAALIVIFT